MRILQIIIFLGLVNGIVAQNPNLELADSLYALGNFSEAINQYAQINDVSAALQIARAYDALGNYNKAVKQYGAIIEKDSSNILAQFELGKIFDKNKRFVIAEKLFENLVLRSPYNPEFFYFLGKAQQKTGNLEASEKALIKAIELDSTHLRSIYLLGKHYVSIEENTKAYDVLDLGLRSEPDDVALLNLKGLALFNNGQQEKAIPYFEKLLELGEQKAFIYKKLGACYVWIEEFDKARDAYRKLEGFPKMEADAYFGLGELFLKEEQLDSAQIYFNRAIKERQRYVFDKEFTHLGRVQRLRGNTKRALENYIKAWEENPRNPYAYWQVCIMSDEYYADPKIKLRRYQKLLSEYVNLPPYLKDRALERIGELKEEIHYSKD